MRYYKDCYGCLLRVNEDGSIKAKSAYSNVWCNLQFPTTEKELLTTGIILPIEFDLAIGRIDSYIKWGKTIVYLTAYWPR